MTDTPPEVKRIQLEIWLAKPAMERLRITLEDNDTLYSFWNTAKKNKAQKKAVNKTVSGQ